MSKILHLSDPHLGEPQDWQLLGSQRSTIGADDRRAQRDVLRETIEALAQDDALLQELDAVVVSGDLTNRGKEDGFAEFDERIAALRDRLGAERLLVVPGNHDVPKDHGPNDRLRYERFNAVTRARRLVTPLLDGIDFSASGTLRLEPEAKRNPHVIATEDAVLIALNSSHFCWGEENISEEEMDRVVAGGLEETVRHLRSQDVARVSNRQMEALVRHLKNLKLQSRPAGDTRVRIAVLHHQLLPVGTREEMKAFESLTNLGAVRALLAELDIDVVLHGHKHQGALYWDHVPRGDDLEATPHRMLVVAAPADFQPGNVAARILSIGSRKAARDVQIVDVSSPPTPGAGISYAKAGTARLWQRPPGSSPTDAMSVRGESVSDVYARLQSIFAERAGDEPLRDIICEVRNPSDVGKVPADYPAPDGVKDVQRWMDDLVDWWQKRESRLLDWTTFNHGERIYRRWGDQVASVAQTLRDTAAGDGQGTTRGLIVLFDQVKDTKRTKDDPEPSFPSFVAAQLQLVQEGGKRRLDCTGYFRKQDMRYWWPINVAELGNVRQRVLEELDTEGIVLGRLRTITAFAKAQDRLPAVAVPTIDRAVDQAQDELWKLAAGAAKPPRAKQQRAELRALWEQRLRELDPAGKDTGARPRISVAGVAQVAQYLKWLNAGDKPVGQAVMRLATLYEDIAEADPSKAPTMAETIRRDLADLRKALDEALRSLPDA
jgi:3',5'-cyclic AMP phosphodiesterase CpdA